MRSGWRVVWAVLAFLAAFSPARLRAEEPSADIDRAAREQLKQDVADEKFEKAERTLEEWRQKSLEKAWGKTLLDDKADQKALQRELEDAIDKKQYGVAQYYL